MPRSSREPLLNVKQTTLQEGLPPASEEQGNRWEEFVGIISISFYTFWVYISWVGMKVTDTAVLGHLGTKWIEASSLSDLYTTSTFVIMDSQTLGTFGAQAFGAGNLKQCGRWFQFSLIFQLGVGIIVIILWNLTNPVLSGFGYSGDLLRNATYFSQMLSISIPFRVFFRQWASWFRGQKIVRPEFYISFVALILNLLGNLALVLGIFTPHWDGFGFPMCPIVTTITAFSQVFLAVAIFILYLKYHRPTWPEEGWSMSIFTRNRFIVYCKFYFPCVFAFASDFWRFNFIGMLAAIIGNEELVAYNISYKVIYIIHQFVGALGSGTAVRCGIHIGGGSIAKAKLSMYIGISITMSCAILLTIIPYLRPELFTKIFTKDQQVIDMLRDAKIPFCITVMTMTVSTAFTKIISGQGRARALLVVSLISSWLIHVPACIICVYVWEKSFVALYWGVAIGYIAMTLVAVALLCTSNWENLVEIARQRVETN